MKKLVLLIILLIPFNINAKDVVTLEKCIDGDTASFYINGNVEKVRFLAINAPEYTSKIEFYGKESSEYVCNKLTNAKTIELEYDPKSDLKDKYDRILAWVYVDNELLQKDLIKNGYAEVSYIYDKYLYVDELCSIQDEAYTNRVGIWNNNRKVGYCYNHKEVFNDEFDLSFIIKYISYIFVLLLTIITFVIFRVLKRRK